MRHISKNMLMSISPRNEVIETMYVCGEGGGGVEIDCQEV